MQKRGLFGMNGFMVFLLTGFSCTARAQQVGNLILIDAENKEAFSVRIGDEFYTSSRHGHLVLPHLKDTVYRLNLRFPRKNLAEQVFPVTVHNKDLGFILKGADSSWILYNWQSRQTIHPVSEHDSSRILELGVKRDDGFSRLMAAVVNDTSVMYNTYTGKGFGRDSAVSNQPPAASRVPSAKSRDSLVAVNDQRPTANGQQPTANGQPPTANDQRPTANGQRPTANGQRPTANGQRPTTNGQRPTALPGIQKIREVSLKISRKMVFLDKGQDGQTDTITLFVYFENTDPQLVKQAGRLPVTGQKAKPVPVACTQLATDGDLESLRTAILEANTDKQKIAAASGVFALKCFSVSQVRLLAALFVSDKSKYNLMDAALGHITDRDHFRELADMYTDRNFQKKFLVMAEKRS
jgi:hypothetical protein